MSPHHLPFSKHPLLIQSTPPKPGAGRPPWGILIYGHYGLFCNTINGPARTRSDLQRVLSTIRPYWPSESEEYYYGVRCFLIEGLRHPGNQYSISPWEKRDNKWDLSDWNEAYFLRLERFAQSFMDMHVVCIMDLWDHWSMYQHFEQSPLHPNNNHQRSYGLPAGTSAFPGWYDLAQYPELAQFQREFTERVMRVLKPRPYCILSTGNEMRDGPVAKRKEWHRQTLQWARTIAPDSAYSENDPAYEVHSIPETQIIEAHKMGGIECSAGGGYSGAPDWGNLSSYGKAVLLDNDGLMDCRSPQTSLEWLKIAMRSSQIYGCKGPFPNTYDAEEEGQWHIWERDFHARLRTTLNEV